jgi:hypothetical protein
MGNGQHCRANQEKAVHTNRVEQLPKVPEVTNAEWGPTIGPTINRQDQGDKATELAGRNEGFVKR